MVAACSGLGTRGGGGGAPANGERYFLGKCNRCHPGGQQGAGPAIDPAVAPTFLQKNGRGRHGVPGAEWVGLIAYMNTAFSSASVGAVATTTTTTTTTPVAPMAMTTATATMPVPVPVASAAPDLATGERVFSARCQKCHPNGQAGVAPDLVGKPLPGPLVVSDAPGRHHVPAAEMGPLLAFVAARGAGSTPVAVATVPVSGDVGAGATFYAASCNRCHPGGQAGVAPAVVGARLPGPLHVAARSDGRHGVPSDAWNNLMAYLVTLGASH
jgi:mono/diheme cytochrome c family protein